MKGSENDPANRGAIGTTAVPNTGAGSDRFRRHPRRVRPGARRCRRCSRGDRREPAPRPVGTPRFGGRGLALGQTDRAIAAALFVSVRTVEGHVARILAKLGVRTRTAAARAAIAAGLVAPDGPTRAAPPR